MKVKSESEVTELCPTLDPIDCSLPGSSVHGIFQARVREWGAIAFSNKGVYITIIAKFGLKLKKVGKTARPFRYDLNQILCNYTVKVKIDSRD